MSQVDTTDAEANHLPGILYMLSGVFVLSIMDAIAKWLVEADYSVFQILAIRGWIIITAFLIFHKYNGTLGSLKSSRLHHHALRAGIGFFAPFCFFTAIGEMPLADAVVIFFAAPFIMSALSFFLLKENVGVHRWSAMAVGFIGVIIVIRPSGDSFQTAALIALGGCIAYSLINIMTRWMSNTEPSHRFVFYFNLGTAVIGSCFLPFVWKDMPLADLGIVGILAAVAICGHLLLTRAFTSAPVSVVAPFEYTALLWSTIIGLLIWGDFPAEHIWLGAAIILASGLYMLHRERVRKIKRPRKFIPRR